MNFLQTHKQAAEYKLQALESATASRIEAGREPNPLTVRLAAAIRKALNLGKYELAADFEGCGIRDPKTWEMVEKIEAM